QWFRSLERDRWQHVAWLGFDDRRSQALQERAALRHPAGTTDGGDADLLRQSAPLHVDGAASGDVYERVELGPDDYRAFALWHADRRVRAFAGCAPSGDDSRWRNLRRERHVHAGGSRTACRDPLGHSCGRPGPRDDAPHRQWDMM